MISTLETPESEAYTLTRNLVYRVCSSFYRTHGGDWREIVSFANEIWIRSWRTWEPHRGGFAKRAAYKIQAGLHGKFLRPHKRDLQIFARVNQEENQMTADNAALDLNEIHTPSLPLNDLSDDANTVVRLALDNNINGPSKRRSFMVRALLELGWTGARILESFGEITEALST